MSTPIETVIALSVTDTNLQNLKRETKSLDKQIAEARVELTELETQLTEKQTELDATRKILADLKNKLEYETQYIDKLESQVKLIRNEKEFVASKKSLEENRRIRGQLEEQFLNNEVKHEELSRIVDDLKQRVDSSSKEFEAGVKSLQSQRKSNDKSKKELEVKRKEILQHLEGPLLKHYKKLLGAGKFPVIVSVANKTCSGCNVELVPQMYNEMLSNPEKFRVCPQCNRILYLSQKPE